MSERDKRIGVFCNISMASLEDDQVLLHLHRLHAREPRPCACDDLRDQRALVQIPFGRCGAQHQGRLKELGFRFSLDKGDGLNFDLPEPQAAGVRFLKIHGERLLEELTPGGERPISSITRDVAPEDVPALFVRYGIDLIAEKVETREVRHRDPRIRDPYGQGHVFGAPRPIKGSLQDDDRAAAGLVRRVCASAM